MNRKTAHERHLALNTYCLVTTDIGNPAYFELLFLKITVSVPNIIRLRINDLPLSCPDYKIKQDENGHKTPSWK
jgi:hypothetical protein